MKKKVVDTTNQKPADTIGGRIRQLRSVLTQVKFSEAVGIKQAMVSRYEANREVPSPKILLRMATHGGKTVEWILCGQDPTIAVSIEEVRGLGEKKGQLSHDDQVNQAILHLVALKFPEALEFTALVKDAFSNPEIMSKLLSHYGYLKSGR